LRYDSLHGLDEPIDRQDAIEKVRDLYGVVDAAIKRNE
jgi:hypothetical protein